MIPAMLNRTPALPPPPPVPWRSVWRWWLRWWQSWWDIVWLGARLAVLSLSPSTYTAPRRARLAWWFGRVNGSLLLGFALLATLISLVVIRIVLVTAASYGLSQFALGMLVRVLVLELVPLAAALAVAVRVAVPLAADLAAMRRSGALRALRQRGVDPLRDEILPRTMAAFLGVPLLALVSSAIALVLAYLVAHGVSPWGLERYTRQVGQVFTPVVSLVLALKTLAFAAAVAVVPAGSGLHDSDSPASPLPLELQGLVRLFAAVLLVELASLVGNYI